MTAFRGCHGLVGLERRLRRLRRAAAAGTSPDSEESQHKMRAAQERIRDHLEDCQECLRIAREAPRRPGGS